MKNELDKTNDTSNCADAKASSACIVILPGDIVYYKWFFGKGYRLFVVLEVTETQIETVAINGYVGTKHNFDKIEKPFKEVGLTQKIASGLLPATDEMINKLRVI